MASLWRIGACLPVAALAMVAACDGGSGSPPTYNLARQENPGSGYNSPGSGFNSPGSGFSDPGTGGNSASGGATLCLACNADLACTQIGDNGKAETVQVSVVPASGGCGVVGADGLVFQCNGEVFVSGQLAGTWTAIPGGFSATVNGIDITCVTSDQVTPPQPIDTPNTGTGVSQVPDAGAGG